MKESGVNWTDRTQTLHQRSSKWIMWQNEWTDILVMSDRHAGPSFKNKMFRFCSNMNENTIFFFTENEYRYTKYLYFLTSFLTPRNKDLDKKLMLTKLALKLPAFYGTWDFIAELKKKAHHQILFWNGWIQYTSSHKNLGLYIILKSMPTYRIWFP